MNLYDHTYQPWSIKDGRCIVNPDLLRGCEELRRLDKQESCFANDEDREGTFAGNKVLIDIPGGDVFGAWDGPVTAEGVEKVVIASNLKDMLLGTGPEATISDLRAALFHTVGACPNLRFLLPTREPERAIKLIPSADNYRRNLALAFRFSDQAQLDKGMPAFVRCAPLCERLLLWWEAGNKGIVLPVDSSKPWSLRYRGLIISGHPTEPVNLDAVRSAIAQCRAAGVRVWQGAIEPAAPWDVGVREDVWAR